MNPSLMNSSKRLLIVFGALILCLSAVHQTAVAQAKSPTAKPSASPQQPSNKPATPGMPEAARKVDHAASYYHYSLAHMYEEMMAMYNRSEYANKAIEEYKLAIENDPASEFLNAGLAEMYARTGRIRDAVLEAQEIIKRDANNLQARKLLGRIYLRSMGDGQSTPSPEILKLAVEQYEAIVRLEPRSVDNHLLLGHLYFLSKDLPNAEKQLKATLEIDPTSEEAVARLAFLYNEQGDNKHAAEILNAVPEAQRTSKIYSMLGYTYEQQKDYKSAIGSYQHSLILDKDNMEALRGLAQNLANDNQTAAAIEQYRILQDADPQDATAPLRLSELYRRSGKFDLAQESLKRAESMQQDSLEVAYNEANLLEAQGKYEEAAAALQKLIARSSAPSDRHNMALFMERLGNVYRQSGKPQLAQETFRKVVELGAPESARGYSGLIDNYRDQKLWSDATRTAQEAVKKLPDDKNLKLALAQQLADEGKTEESISLAQSVVKASPGDHEALISMSQIYTRVKHWQEAEDILNGLLKESTRPEEQVYVRFILGATYERQKKIDLAEQSFRKVLQLDPGSAGTLNYLGYMMADHNMHLEESLNLIKRAVELEPQNGAYLDSLGWAYFKMGNLELAEQNLRRAAEKNPNDATVHDHLAELYARTGKLKQAVTHWERALQEWNRSVPYDVDQQDVARVTKKLESTKVKLAQQQPK